MNIWSDLKWDNYIDQIEDEPGLIILEQGEKDGHYFLSGLRDPHANDPFVLMENQNIDSENVRTDWQTYYALVDHLIEKRADQLLNPPDQVSFEIKNQVLIIEGNADFRWINFVKDHYQKVFGIHNIDIEKLKDPEFNSLQEIMQMIEKYSFQFKINTTYFLPNQDQKINQVVQRIKKLTETASQLNLDIMIFVQGHTDASGETSKNQNLSFDRSKVFTHRLIQAGLSPSMFSMMGLGASQPLVEEKTDEDRELNRAVTLEIRIKDKID